jgi:hypothetical protein
MKTKNDYANEIASKMDALRSDLLCGKITAAQHHNAIKTLYSDTQKASGYADAAFAQVWQKASRMSMLRTARWCGKHDC